MPNESTRGADRKATALVFLHAARRGERATLERLVTPGARHHNAYVPAGMPALLDAMQEAARGMPDGRLEVQRVLADGDLVAVHSRVVRHAGDAGIAVVHILRFEGERIAELWDVGQLVPAELPNADGMF